MTAFAFLVLGLLLGSAFGWAAGHWHGRARRALSELSQARLEVAQGAAASDLAERQHSIEAMVSPLRDALQQVQAQLHNAERDRLTATAALDEHLSAMRLSSDGLRSETAQRIVIVLPPVTGALVVSQPVDP